MVGSVPIAADLDVAADVKPIPVSVAPVAVSAVIARVPGPARPVPCGAASVHAVPVAAPAGSVQITTSVPPGWPYVPVAVKPPPAAVRAVAEAAMGELPRAGSGSRADVQAALV